MSEPQSISLWAQMVQSLKEITTILRIGFQTLTNAILRTGQIQASIGAIGKRGADLWKQLGAGAAGQKKGNVPMADVNSIIGDLFSGKADIFAGMAPAAGVGGGTKKKKGIGAMFKSIGKTMSAAFGPIALIMQILGPLINAFLEPLEMLSPLMEEWGMILSSLLVPIMFALMDAMGPMTPMFISLVFALMPIVDILVSLINMLSPVLVILTVVVTTLLTWIGVVTTLASSVTVFFTVIQVGLSGIRDKFTAFAGNIIADAVGFGDKLRNTFKDAIEKIVTGIKDKFEIFKGGGLDNNEETWW